MTLNFGGGDLFGKATDEGRIGRQQYISIPASAFISRFSATDAVQTDAVKIIMTDGFPNLIIAPVFLPHNSQIDTIQTFGSNTDMFGSITRVLFDITASDSIASASINSIGVSNQSFNIVDNQNYRYHVIITAIVQNDSIYGVTIAYTI